MLQHLPPLGTGEPTFIYDPIEPGLNRFNVWARAPHYTSDRRLGTVYETAGAGWVADWSPSEDHTEPAMPGFGSKEDAASALYWFQPPKQSTISAQWYQPTDVWVNATITVRAETEDSAQFAATLAADALGRGERTFEDSQTTYDVKLTASDN